MAGLGYVPLAARVDGLAFHATLFARAHVSAAGDAALPAKRTLFLLNVPPTTDEASLAAAFEAKAGDVASAKVGSVGDARSAHVVFAQPSGLKKALALTKPLELGPSGSVGSSSGGSGGSSNSGSSHHSGGRTSLHAFSVAPSREKLQALVGTFMEKFEAEEAARRAEEDARHNSMDADGFVVVTRKRTGRGTATDPASGATAHAATAGMQRVHAAAAAAGADGEDGDAAAADGDESRAAKRKKKKAKLDADFYHFQQHEKKREGLLKLREQFEADRERIAKMRADRKFKPQGY